MVAVYAPDAPFAGTTLARDIFIAKRRANLIGEFLFGQDLLQSRENSANLAVPATEALIGGPVPPIYGNLEVELGNGAGLDTMILQPNGAHTVLIVCSAQQLDYALVSESCILSGASSSFAGRLNIVTEAANRVLQAVIVDNSFTAAPLPIGPARPMNALRCMIVSVAGTAQGANLKISEYVGGALAQTNTTPLAAARTAPTGTSVQGNSSSVAAGGNYLTRTRHSVRTEWAAELTDAEKLAEYLFVRAVLAGAGKTIL